MPDDLNCQFLRLAWKHQLPSCRFVRYDRCTYAKYNTLLNENQYGAKYDIGNAQLFIIEGMDKVKDVIEKNRKCKLTKHKKLSNNTVIEIDNCVPCLKF